MLCPAANGSDPNKPPANSHRLPCYVIASQCEHWRGNPFSPQGTVPIPTNLRQIRMRIPPPPSVVPLPLTREAGSTPYQRRDEGIPPYDARLEIFRRPVGRADPCPPAVECGDTNHPPANPHRLPAPSSTANAVPLPPGEGFLDGARFTHYVLSKILRISSLARERPVLPLGEGGPPKVVDEGVEQ